MAQSAESGSSRIVLIVAAMLAIVAVAVAVWRGQQAPPTPVSPPVAATGGPAGAPGAGQPDAQAMITQLEARLKANPNDAEGWRFLGLAFFDTGRFAESATAYKRATALAPAKAEYWSSLGEALVLAGTGPVAPDARAAFRTAIERDPADPRARYYLGVAKDGDGDHKGAIDDWFALLASAPSDAPWAADVRKAIVDVAALNKIDVTARLASVKMAPPLGGVATAAIPGPTPDQMRNAVGLPKGQQDAMVTQMVESLATKLAANPKNVDGWIMLMRSRVTLGETVKASAALKSAIAANPGEAAKLNTAARELGISG